MPRTRSIAWSELKLGIVAIAALALATMLIIAISGEGGFFAERYPLKVRFADARGLTDGALVRLSGKEVGIVTTVEFQGAEIEIAMELNADVRPLVTTDSVATIGSLSLLGESMIDIRAAATGAPLPDWAYLRTADTVLIADVTQTAARGLEEVNRLLVDLRAGRGTLGKLVTDEALYREMEQFVASAADVTRQMNSGRGTVGRLMSDPAAYNALRASLENLQATTARINSGQGALGRFLHDEALGNSLSGTVANLEQTTARLSRGDGTMGKLLNERELYDRLNSMANRIDQVVAGLESGQGTAGRLLRDQQLYDNMNRTVNELGSLLTEIKKDPKKYLRVHVSIF